MKVEWWLGGYLLIVYGLDLRCRLRLLSIVLIFRLGRGRRVIGGWLGCLLFGSGFGFDWVAPVASLVGTGRRNPFCQQGLRYGRL